MTYSRKSWFRHQAISTSQADSLINQYTKKGYHVEKILNTDPKFWDVAVKLEENNKKILTPRCMINKVWNSPLYKKSTVV